MLIDGDYLDHLIGSPLALADEAYAAKAWVKYSDLPALQVPNIHVLQGTVKTVDCASKAATFVRTGTTDEEQLSYDYMVVASGLRRAWPVVPQSLRRKQFLFEAGDHINAVTNSTAGVVVVGGGAVGIEMAAELKLVHPQAKVTLVHSRDKLLSSEPLPDECKDRAMELIREAGVDLLMSHRVEDTAQVKDASGKPATEVSFTNGHTMQASVVIVAISKAIPSTSFLPAEALESNGRGHVRIRPNLMFPSEVPNADSHLAIGDVVAWSGIKRCGGAMHMGYFAAANMHEMMLEKMHVAKTARLNELAEIAPMIGLAVGKKAVSYGPAQGVLSGEDVMKAFFGNDLGFDSKSRVLSNFESLTN